MATGKKEMVTILAEKTGFTKKQTTQFIDALQEAVTEKLVAGDRVQLIGFGTFIANKRSARQGRSPSTGEQIAIPEKIMPAFKPGKGLREKVNGR